MLSRYWADETGSAAVDWVALAGGIILLGIMTVYSLFSVGVSDVTLAIEEAMVAADCRAGIPADTGGVGEETTGTARPCPDTHPRPDLNN